MKRNLFIALLWLSFLYCTGAQVVDPVYKADGVIAIKGADPVAYFKENRPVIGDKNFQLVWNGAKWYFSSQANLTAFAKHPEDFAPQYGGYCAYAMRDGETYDIDPKAWAIVNGKLYLNYNEKVNGFWSRDIPGNIAKADKQWNLLPKKK
ncbi:YHS domain protein [Leptospira perolatii]|uniref:YHS domain protein n=1 Tax=Leptospira perolatii TaxID=2023191 RepID=A0A2M9ZLT1_9LEPT|nr:YHS domain-containing (seleno)protein [Leptospira perolatii]PJZ69788.1 YHS domain protein [Leptospira perolatii]PJZ72997.1 YHS domain protein [Leptospira perolatii]